MTDDINTAQKLSNDPCQIAGMFFGALNWYPDSIGEFQYLMTPEALAAGGSIEMAAALFRSIDDPGLGQTARYEDGHPDVANVRVFRGVTASGFIPSGTPLDDPLYITMVLRPECGGWVVHHFGDAALPDSVPRGP